MADCGQNDPPQAGSDKIAIETTRQEFLKAYKTGDAAGLAACCADDVVQLHPNEPAVRGKDAVRTWYEAQFDRFACELSVVTEELEIAGSWAFPYSSLLPFILIWRKGEQSRSNYRRPILANGVNILSICSPRLQHT